MKLSIPALLASLALAAVASPAHAHSRHRRPTELGTVLVTNRAGVAVTVSVEGAGSRTLRAYETEAFATTAGYAGVHASFRQYGGVVPLLDTEVRVRGYRTSSVEVYAPSTGRVQVENETGVRSEVFVNGREVAELGVGATRILTLPLGRAELSMVANGREVESSCVDVRPFAETVLVGRAPRFADLVVVNPLPIAVDVRLDGGGAERRIAAFSRTTFPSVLVGEVNVTASRLGGGAFDTDRAFVSPWSGAAVTVDAPRTGFVKLDSHDDDLVRVFADGHLVATLQPGAEGLVELPVGDATIEVRRLDGRLVECVRVEVEPYRVMGVDFGRYERGQHRRDERSDERHDEPVSQRDDRDGEHEGARRHETATR